jgi:G3E family GTPase
MNESERNKIPVTILTGFLGSGKTTLLNRILTAPHGFRIAVIVNEFGEVGIDHQLLISSDEEIVQMNNGCICCTVHGDLLRVLFQLLDQRANFDTLLLETTGLADPAAVAQTFLVDERIRREFSMNQIVTLVDAKHIEGELESQVEAQEQIAFADTILLNKMDLVSTDELDQLESKIHGLNTTATVFRTKNADIDIPTLLTTKAFDLEQKLNSSPDFLSEQNHNHSSSISTVSIVEPGTLDKAKLSHWFRSVLNDQGSNILRMKGILNLRGDTQQFVFHGVHMMFEGRLGRDWAENENRLNRLVFIGRDLDREKLLQGFKESFYSENGVETSGIGPTSDDEISPYTLDQIRVWVRQALEFPPQAPVVVKEVPCVKPGCPPIETAIMVLLEHEPPRFYKIQKTLRSPSQLVQVTRHLYWDPPR